MRTKHSGDKDNHENNDGQKINFEQKWAQGSSKRDLA